MEYETRWNNVGLWKAGTHVGASTPWGNLVIKPWSDRLFSERYGNRKVAKVFGLCISWVRLRAPSHPIQEDRE